MTVYFQIAEVYDTTNRSIYPYQDAGRPDVAFNSANVRSAITIAEGSDSTQYVGSPTPFSATDLWVHFNVYWYLDRSPNASESTKSMFRLMAGGVQRIRVTPNNSDSMLLEAWNGSSWTLLTSYSQSNMNYNSGRHTFDVHATVAVNGTITVYRDNTIILNVTNYDTTFGGTVSAFDEVRWGCPNVGFNSVTFYSEMIGADWNTIGSKLVSKGPDANGTYSDWTNDDFTVVDDIGLDGNYATSDAANQRVDWSMGSFPTPTANEQIVSVEINAMINRDNTGPQNANFFIRQGGTDYDANDKSVNDVQAPIKERYELNPATSTLWTDTALNSSTYGIRSRT